jgi:hypothetical protein
MLGKLKFYVTRVSVFLIPVALVVGTAGFDGAGGGPILRPFQNSPPQNLEIWTWYDLDAVRNNLAGNHTLMNDLDSTTPGYWELASLIANQGKGWEPIGLVQLIFFDDPFGCSGGSREDWYGLSGTFDGQGYEIRDLFIDRPIENDIALFGAVDEGGVIKDIGAVNFTVIGEHYVAGLVGRNRGTVSNSYSTGSVTGDGYVGGLVGTMESSRAAVSNSYSICNVIGSSAIGGLVGWNHLGTVTNSYYNYDKVLINGENMITIGALFGEDFDEWLANDRFSDANEKLPQEDGYYLIHDVRDFKQLLAFGQDGSLKFRLANDLDLSGDPNFYIPYLAAQFDGNGHKVANLSLIDLASPLGLFGYLTPGGKVAHVGVENVNITRAGEVGGLVGASYGTVSNSYSTGSVTGTTGVGGLVGFNGGTVSDSYSSSDITGDSYVGGLVGFNLEEGTVSNCYFSGDITGDSYVGGLVGVNEGGTVTDSCSTGTVTGDWHVGGLVALNNGGTVSNSYSSGSVTGTRDVGGLVGINDRGTVSNSFWDVQTSGQTRSAGGTGKTTAKMKGIATFSGAGWNIIAVASAGMRNPAYIWNIVTGVTYPFLSWQP